MVKLKIILEQMQNCLENVFRELILMACCQNRKSRDPHKSILCYLPVSLTSWMMAGRIFLLQ